MARSARMRPIVEAPIKSVILWYSRLTGEFLKGADPASSAHQLGLADALKFALIGEQMHNSASRFVTEQIGNRFAQINISLWKGSVSKQGCVEMALSSGAWADRTEEG